jgi:hypothetical protein
VRGRRKGIRAIAGFGSRAPLNPRVSRVCERRSHRCTNFLRACADALRKRENPPSLDAVEQALAKFTATIEELRLEGATRALPLGFTLEQLRRNLEDFRNRVVECARAAG